MKSVLVLLMLVFVSSASHAFFPKMACWLKNVDEEKRDQFKTPLIVEYLDDGIIEVRYRGLSCELDWVEHKGRKYKGWVRFANKNSGQDGRNLTSPCSFVVNSFLHFSGLETTDLVWLTLSDKITNETKRKYELQKNDPELLAQLGFYNTHDPSAGAVVKRMMNCKMLSNP